MSARGDDVSQNIELQAFAATHVGLVREGNEDSHLSGGNVFAVADGMGGHAAGEVASRTALEPIAALDGRAFSSGQEAQDALIEAVTAANQAVVAEGDADPSLQGMGTTLTAVLFREGRLHMAHVGDSRAYLLRHGESISQLTTDHTLVEQLVREGRLSREQAAVHPQRSVITRAIGVERDVQVDSLPPLELQPGDQVLLCSDGLTGPVPDADIADIVGTTADGQAAVDALIDAANAAGGPDNITVVLLRVASSDAAVPQTDAGEDQDTAATQGFSSVPPPGAPARTAEGARQIRTRVESDDSTSWAERMGRYGSRQGAARTPQPRRRKGRLVAVVLGVILLLGLLAAGGYWLLQRSFFVGDADGRIAIFNGIPESAVGLDLHWVREETDLRTDDLPEFRARRVREGVPARSLVNAREIVENYREQIEAADEDTGP